MKIHEHERCQWKAGINPMLKKLRYRNRCNRVRLHDAMCRSSRHIANNPKKIGKVKMCKDQSVTAQEREVFCERASRGDRMFSFAIEKERTVYFDRPGKYPIRITSDEYGSFSGGHSLIEVVPWVGY